MTKIDQNTLATIDFEVNWRSETVSHTDGFFAEKVNFWRDMFPHKLYDALMGRLPGDVFQIDFIADENPLSYEDKNIFSVQLSQIDNQVLPGNRFHPKIGRFFPKGILRDVSGVFRGNMEPFRCVGLDNGNMRVNFNHPLADTVLRLSVKILDVRKKPGETGGSSTNWMEMILNGPGMQGRWKGLPTDFFSGAPFKRANEREDTLFYQKPRLVTHIDDAAIDVITGFYGKLLSPGMDILDLMSSWRSHLPQKMDFNSVSGLGLNETELENNPQLSEYVVHDLNQEPRLPFADAIFDAVICTVSIEYLIHPFEIFKEVARVLKPDGYFITTFSDRWFPPKVIQIWTETHPFERVGLVNELFIQSEKFKNIKTYTMRGLPRPESDKYYPKIRNSDPVYAIWGQKR